LALRKHGSDKVAELLEDAEPRIVAEAARAIYDDRLMNAFPALAKFADKPAQPDAIAYRALAACFWGGTPEDAARVARFAGRAAGRAVQARLDPAAVLKDLPDLLKDDSVSVAEKQGAFAILAAPRPSADTDKLLGEWLDAALAGKVPGEIVLDVLDAAESRAK